MAEHEAPSRVALYLRKSNDPNKIRASTQRQEQRGRAMLASLGLPAPVAVYVDDDRSAFDTSVIRESFVSMIAAMPTGTFDAIWVWEQERLYRRPTDFDLVTDAAIEAGIRFIVDDKWFDPNDEDQWFMQGLSSLMGAREVRKLKRRTRQGREHMASLGKPSGRPGYGYTAVYDVSRGGVQDKKSRKDIVDPGQAAEIRWMAREIMAGNSMQSVANGLNARGVPPPQGSSWTRMSVQTTLLRPKLVGDLVFRGEIVGPGEWEAILDRETYAAVAAVLTARRGTTPPSPRLKHLLGGLIQCSKCDGRVGIQHDSKRVKTPSVRYCCQSNHCVSRKVESVDIVVEDHVLAWLASEEAQAILEAARTEEGRDAAAEAEELRQRLEQLAEDYYVHKLVDRATFTSTSMALRPRLEELENEADHGVALPVLAEAAGADVVERWASYDLIRKRLIIRELFHIVMLPTGSGRRKFDREAIVVTPRLRLEVDTA